MTPGDSLKSTYRQGVDQVVNKFLFDMRGEGPLTLFFQRKEICQRKANICHGLHVTTISGLYYFGSLMETKMDLVIEVIDSQAFPWKIFSWLNSFFSSLKMSYHRKAFNPVERTFLEDCQYNWSTICEMLLWHNFLAELFIDSEERKNLI